jgi:hypothetical protein
MLGRALSLATVMFLVGFAAERTLAQENLEAGKTPSQIFAGTCSACHKGPRGLLKTVPAGSLSSFLRQHYTTSPNMAGLLANYLVSNGATDTRLPREGSRDAKQEAKQEAKQDARPAVPPEQPDRSGRKPRPATAGREPKSEPAARPDEAELPAPAVVDHGPDGGKSTKQRMSKRGKPGDEPPKAEGSPIGEAPTAKEEAKSEVAKPPGEAPAESAKAEPTGDAPITRPDPVVEIPPATASSPDPAASGTAMPPPLSPAALSAVVAGTTTEAPAVPLPSTPAPAPGPAITAAVPPLPPVTPAGPPAPPISQ